MNEGLLQHQKILVKLRMLILAHILSMLALLSHFPVCKVFRHFFFPELILKRILKVVKDMNSMRLL